MADVYIDSTAGGTNSGTQANPYNAGTQVDWTNAATDASVAGDIVWVAHDNLTTLGADLDFTVNANHTEDNPLKIVVANSATWTPVSTYGASGNGEIDCNNNHFSPSGHATIHGLRVSTSDSCNIGGGSSGSIRWEKCFLLIDKSTGENFFTSSETSIVFVDTDIDIQTSDHDLQLLDNTTWLFYGGSITTDANVTKVFDIISATGGYVELNNVDLTGINASTDIFNDTGIGLIQAFLNNCNFAATLPTIFGAAATGMSSGHQIIASGNQAEISAQYRKGTVVDETTIYRASGATDGSTNYSLKMEPNSNATRAAPFRHLMTVTNPGDLDTLTIKVHFAQNSGGAIDDGDVWIECYAATSAAISTNTDRLDLGETTTTNHTDESASVDWRDGAGALTGYNEQSCSVTVSGATEGILYIYFCAAADFTTTNNLYVDPLPVIA